MECAMPNIVKIIGQNNWKKYMYVCSLVN